MAVSASARERRQQTCRLLYIVGSLHTGGLERQLCYLLAGLDRERYRPAVVVWNHREQDAHVAQVRELSVPIHAFPAASKGAAKLRGLAALVAALRPEVIHSYSFYTNVAASYAARSARCVAVGSIRSDFRWGIRECGPVLGRLSARWPGNQISNSSSAAASAARSRPRFLVTPRIFVVRNGIDLDRFSPSAPPAAPPLKMLGVGDLSAVKQWDVLVAAAGRLKQEGLNFTVEIAGNGPCRGALDSQVVALGLQKTVRFLGQIEDVPRALAAAAFLVHTAAAEGCPNAVMEAMACGRAVLATAVGDIPVLVEHQKTGLLVPPNDPNALADHARVLIQQPERCAAMGEAGRAKAIREFGISRLVEETLSVYRRAGWAVD